VQNWVKKETSGKYEELMLELLKPRADVAPPGSVEADVSTLYHAGEGRLGTDERAFINVFAHRPLAHIAAVADAYPNFHKNKHRHTLHHAIESEFSGHLRQVLYNPLSVGFLGGGVEVR
jgi:hypothetical protein